MKIETADDPIVKTPKYEKHLGALENGKRLINLERKIYQGVRMAFYRSELNERYRMVTLRQQDGKYSISLNIRKAKC